jgi:phosphoserine phosphatase RsbU/P
MTVRVDSNHADTASADMPGLGPVTQSRTERSERPRILVSDDQHDILTALELLLKLNGYQTRKADSPGELLRAAQDGSFDLVLMDLNYTRDTTSGREGIELLAELRRIHSSSLRVTPPIVVMTAWGNVELAVEAMRLGASDFVQKPWDNARLLQTLSRQLERSAEARIAEAKVRSELEIASHVQQKLFPQHLKAVQGLDYAGQCIPAKVVGGDYYDFFDTGKSQLAFVLADVSGKGVAAAMLMANLQACFRTQFEAGVREPRELLQTANRLFFDSTPAAQYVTLFYGEYCSATERLQYVNCGHPAPMLIRSDGRLEQLESTGTVLGLFGDWRPAGVLDVHFGSGDFLLAFTDGITDAILPDGSEFGEDRLIDSAFQLRTLPAAEGIGRIVSLTEQMNESELSFDDRTAVILRRF